MVPFRTDFGETRVVVFSHVLTNHKNDIYLEQSRMTSLKEQLRQPSGIALVYFLFGISWIVVSDFLVLSIIDDAETVTFV